jgi:2-amino-4-hydroxy-6-hydroxymethyldihydropteridine diphosphokinase
MKSEPLRERRVFIGLGSNLGDRVENLRQAICLMQVHGLKVLRVSSLYETEPVETCEPQPNYINAVAEVVTDLPLPKLLEVLEQIERKLGRESKGDKKPRTVDLDILWAEGERIDSERLKVPHPRLWERAFVLMPLSELVDELDGKPVAEVARSLSDRQKILKIAEGQLLIEERECRVL